MKIRNIHQLNDFLAAVNQCQGGVWLESPEGDKYNLKSQFSQYIALGALLTQHGANLELFCSHTQDEQLFFQFLAEHPDVQA